MKCFYLLPIICLTIIYYSCENHPPSREAQLALEMENYNPPLTDDEIAFSDSLDKIGYPNQLERNCIGCTGDKMLNYYITLECKSKEVRRDNIDSLELFRRALVNKLYKDVIEDSVLYDMSILIAEFDKIEYKESVLKKRFFYIENYRKDLLEQWNGFKVIKVGKDKYKRVSLSE